MKTTIPAGLGFAVILLACERGQTPSPSGQEHSSASDPAALNGPPAAQGREPGDQSGVTEPQPQPQETLNDDQILGFTHTANLGEIEQGKLAESKAEDARVKKFATMMVKDHSDADSKGRTVATKANLNLATSPMSTALESDARHATMTLKAESGAGFDRGYVDTQVKEHQAVLDDIDQKLVPNAQNADVKTYLGDVRKTVANHLKHAQDLQKEMQR